MKIKDWTGLFFLLLIILFFSCAKRDFPPGGPVDLTPPQVLEVFPPDTSLNIDINIEITLTFNEGMDKEKTEKSIFISPVPETPFKFKWKKNKLVLEPSQPLQKDRTYVINLGANASDLHNNKLEKSYSFAFSTGEKLDAGFISGKTFFQSKKEKGVSVWAYPLLRDKEPDPQKDKPEYATLSDQKGEYNLNYLAKGLYRIFAVKDLNNDLLWDPDKEPLGVTMKDVNISLDSLSFSGIDFTLIQRDTTTPTLVNCQSLDKRTVRLEFDKSLSSRAGQGLYEKDNYGILSNSSLKESLEVELVYTKSEDYQKIYLITDEMAKKKYTVYVQNLFDLAGNPINPQSNNCIFEGSELEDKAPLKILSTDPQPGAKNILLDSEIKLFFEKPPEKNSAEKGFVLQDSLEEVVEGNFFWENPAVLIFKSDKIIQGKMKYELSFKDLMDLWGNPFVDTSFKLVFTTLNPDTLGSISGRVENLTDNKVEIAITMEKMEIPRLKYEKKFKEPGEFKFENIFPGKYNLKAYLDLNGNGILDQGKVFPFEPAEPEIFYPDTLNIRPRWETEGVILKFR